MALIWRNTARNYLIQCCTFHTSSNVTSKSAKIMKKVLSGGSTRKKRIYLDSPILPSPGSFSQGVNEGRHSGNSKRTSVLNKLFMRHITDLMATGENASEFLGRGIEISRVAVSPDFKGLNVFWIAKGIEKNDDTIDIILRKNAGFLRHELSTLRVMGVVPLISFVKDKQYAKVIELESRLAIADFGDDHISMRTENRLRSELELIAPLEQSTRQKIVDMDKETGGIEDEDPLPPMPQDVLGFNHSDIMNRVKKSMKKSEALHRLEKIDESDGIQATFNENPIEFKNKNEKREAFRQFLQGREIQRSKARKLDKNYTPDYEYIKEEIRERNLKYFDNMDVYYHEDDDYLCDEDEEKK